MKYITALAEFEDILNGAEDQLVAVDFTATWCPPCKMIGPKFEKMEKDFTEDKRKVIFLKVDVDEGEEITEKYPVKAMPTFMFFKKAKKVDELVGADEKKLLEKLNALSPSPTDQSTKT